MMLSSNFCMKNLSLLMLMFLALALAFSAVLQAAVVPLDDAWQPNGPIYTVEMVKGDGANSAFIGGDFTYIGPESGSAVAVSSAAPNQTLFDLTFTGTGSDIGVYVAIASDNGGWYIGGDFTQVIDSSGPQDRNNLAEIDADGNVLAWDPNVNNIVRTLLLDAVNGTLYVGGDFIEVNGGTTRNRLAAFDTSDNTLTTWDPNASGPVRAMALGNANENLYVGGDFTSIGGAARNRIAHFNLLAVNSEDVATGWNPNADGLVRAMALDNANENLYVGGDFTSIGGAARNRIAHFNLLAVGSEDVATSWNPGADAVVRTLALLGDSLYIGGDFATINNANWFGFAVSDVSNIPSLNIVDWSGNRLPFIGAEEARISVTQIIASGGFIYVASNGELDTDTSNRTVSRVAVLNPLSGAVSWSTDTSGGLINTIAVASGQIFVGGTFESGGGRIRSNIAKLDLSASTSRGAATEWNIFVNGPVYSIASTNNGQGIYIGGQFSAVVNTLAQGLRNNIALLDVSSNNAAFWNPSVTGTDAKVRALVLSPDEETLYVGGLFSHVTNISRNNIAMLRAKVTGVDGEGVLNTATSAIGQFDGANGEVHALAVSSDNELVFAGGDFTIIGGNFKSKVAALSVANGKPLPNDSWAVTYVNQTVRTLILSSDDKTLYLGGDFTEIIDETATYGALGFVAALDVDPGGDKWRVIPTFNPGATGATGATGIHSLTVSTDDQMLWLGGDFSNVAGSGRNRAARLNLNEASPYDLTEWNPNISIGTAIYAMERNADDSLVIMGGDFNTVGSGAAAITRNNLAIFDTTRPTVTNHVVGGFYSTDSLDVILSCTHNSTAGPCEIYYTKDGSDPMESNVGAVEPDPVTYYSLYVQPPPAPPEPPPPPRIDTIIADTEVKFFVKDAHGTVSEINSASYGLDAAFPTTAVQPNVILKNILHADIYKEISNTGIEIALVCEDSGGANCDNTYYTTDGSDPHNDDGTRSDTAQLYESPLTPKQLLPLDSYTLADLVGDEQDVFEEMTLADIVSSIQEAEFRLDLTQFTLADIPSVAVARNSIELSRVFEHVDLAAVRIDSISADILANVVASANIPEGAETFADIDLEDLDLSQITLGSISRAAYSLADIPASLTPPPTYITASQVPLIQRVLGGEDNYVVLDAVIKENITLEQIPAEFIPRTRLYGFIELRFFSIDRAGNSEAIAPGPGPGPATGVKREIYYVDIGAPETAATPNTGGNVFTSEIYVVLECYDYGDTVSGFNDLPSGVTTEPTGSGCREGGTYYTIGGGLPTPSEVGTGGATEVYTGPIAVSSASVIRFLSVDELGNEEVSGFEVYAFTFSSVGRSGVGASGLAVWLFALFGLLLRWRSVRMTLH